MQKKWILLFLLGLTNLNLFLFAQQSDRRRAEFEELNKKRVEFFTKALELNAEEAKGFWPLFNDLQTKKIQLYQERGRTLSQFTGNGRDNNNRRKLTENEYKEIVNIFAQFKVKEAKLEEEYILKFAKVISYEKIFKYQQAEQQFERQMLNQRRENVSPPRNGR